MSAEGSPVASPDRPLEIHLVDESAELEARAREVAEARYAEEMAGANILKRIWQGNLARDHYLYKHTQQARQEMTEADNLYTHADLDRAEVQQELLADVERFSSQYDDQLDAGESKHELAGSAEEQGLRDQLKGLVRDYASGALTASTFEEERTRVLNSLDGLPAEVRGKGLLYADNLLEIARQVEQRVHAGEVLEDILDQTKVYVDRSEFGVRSEIGSGVVERTLEWAKQRQLGALANEGVLVGGITLGCSLARYSARTALGAAGQFAIPGLAAGALAAAREHKRLKEERWQVARGMAQGEQIDAEAAPRRAEIAETVYGMRSANDLRHDLDSSVFEFNAEGHRQPREFDQAEFAQALAVLADVSGRRELSDRGLDLISFSDATTVASERRALYLSVAESKVMLRRALADNPELRGDLPEGEFDELLRSMVEAENGALESLSADVGGKDKLFNRLRRGKVGRAAAKGALFGAALGLAAQEVAAILRSDQDGGVESLWNHHRPDGEHQTLLRYVRHMIGSEDGFLEPEGGQEGALGDGDVVRVPEGADLVQAEDGSYRLLRGDEVLAGDLKFEDGQLTPDSLSRLREQGVGASTDQVVIETPSTETVTTSPQEYAARHGDELTRVKRTLWYDNDTPAPNYDLNELRLHWGGQSGSGIDGEGNYVFNVARMTEDGSFHTPFEADAPELINEGRMEILLSVSRDTQDTVFSVPVDADGNAVIDANSEAGRLLFQNHGGQAEFVGRYAEAAEMLGEQEGAERVRLLATYEGDGLEQVTDTVTTTETVTNTVTTLEVPLPEAVIDVPPVIPIYGRKPLEPAANPAATAPVAGSFGELNAGSQPQGELKPAPGAYGELMRGSGETTGVQPREVPPDESEGEVTSPQEELKERLQTARREWNKTESEAVYEEMVSRGIIRVSKNGPGKGRDLKFNSDQDHKLYERWRQIDREIGYYESVKKRLEAVRSLAELEKVGGRILSDIVVRDKQGRTAGADWRFGVLAEAYISAQARLSAEATDASQPSASPEGEAAGRTGVYEEAASEQVPVGNEQRELERPPAPRSDTEAAPAAIELPPAPKESGSASTEVERINGAIPLPEPAVAQVPIINSLTDQQAQGLIERVKDGQVDQVYKFLSTAGLVHKVTGENRVSRIEPADDPNTASVYQAVQAAWRSQQAKLREFKEGITLDFQGFSQSSELERALKVWRDKGSIRRRGKGYEAIDDRGKIILEAARKVREALTSAQSPKTQAGSA
ncbi:hypothetical protein KY386_02985 [Candidatus Parcubacteria bacterium]|nr:hypothetical protein [Candidatus Parcubacteria bacterium]